MPGLSLEMVAGADGSTREVRWVHISELDDPTPWLQGGELLLTTGMWLKDGVSGSDYVHRLADAKLAGIGFGVGMGSPQVPAEMIAASNERGIPLIRVPVDTPYVAISEAVANLLAAARFEAISRAFDAQQRLTKSALEQRPALLRQLARELGGWAAQADASGEVLHVCPPDAASKVTAILPDLEETRHTGRSMSAIVTAASTCVIQPLSVGGVTRGYLMAGLDSSMGTYERSVLNASVNLLSLELERSHTVLVKTQRLRAVGLRQALTDPRISRDFVGQVSDWGVDVAALRICVLFMPPSSLTAASEEITDTLAGGDIAGACTIVDGAERHVAILIGDDAASIAAVRKAAAERAGSYLGVGTVVGASDLRRSHRRAIVAATIGRINRNPMCDFDDLAAMQLLVGAADADRMSAFVEQVLGPLAYSRLNGRNKELKRTLEAFLQANGHWGEAANRLGVHRHTLRSRMERIAALTHRDPSSAYGQMELWFAVLVEESVLGRS